MAIKRWNGSTSQWELVGTPGTATPSAIGAATLASTGNTFLGVQTLNVASEWPLISRSINATSTHRNHLLMQRSNNNTAVTAGFNLGGISMAGHDGTSYASGWNGGAEITAHASQTWTSSARGTDLAFSTTANNTNFIAERMRIAASGNIGIGTGNPGAKLHVGRNTTSILTGVNAVFAADSNNPYGGIQINSYDDDAKRFAIINDNGGTFIKSVGAQAYLIVGTDSAQPLALYTNNLERFKIDSSGNVLITNNGVDTLRYFDIYNTSSGNSAGTIIRMITNNAANTAVTTVDIVKYRNGYLGILNNDASAVTGFGTAGVERMRIDSSGNVGIGNTSPGGKLQITVPSSERLPVLGTAYGSFRLLGSTNAWGLYMGIKDDTGAGSIQVMRGDSTVAYDLFLQPVGGNTIIGYSSSQGAYKLQVNSQIFATSSSIATSDGRYKENVNTITSGLDIVNSLRPVSFTWKEHPVHNFVAGKTVGFIAQEVKESLSEYDWIDNIIKTNTSDAILDEEGNEVTPAEEFLGIAESNIIPLLVAAVKELKARVETLEAN
jgi:hypothetical protein